MNCLHKKDNNNICNNNICNNNMYNNNMRLYFSLM